MPHVCVSVGCAPVPVCGGLRSTFVVFPHHSPLLLRQGLSVNLKLSVQLNWLSNERQDLPASSHHPTEVGYTCTTVLNFIHSFTHPFTLSFEIGFLCVSPADLELTL